MASNSIRASLMRLSPVSSPISCFLLRQCTATAKYSSLIRQIKYQPSISTKVCEIKLHAPLAAVSASCTHGWQHQRRGIAADTKTTAVTIWEDLKQMRFSPVPALVLGFSGLIPFVAPPAYMILTQAVYSQLVFAQTAYGACILSFLGGVRWGFVIPEENEHQPDWFNLGYSVTPSLVAWVAVLMPQPLSILLVMSGIAGSAYFDTAVKGYPQWFKGLRFTLSFGAVLSLWTVFLCQYILSAPTEILDSDTAQTKWNVLIFQGIILSNFVSMFKQAPSHCNCMTKLSILVYKMCQT